MMLRTAPRNRETLSVTWNSGRWKVFVEEQRYGSVLFLACPTCSAMQVNPAFITNMAVTYRLTPQWNITVGANNLGNQYPTRTYGAAATTTHGQFKYPYYAPFGINGGMYYVQTSLNF